MKALIFDMDGTLGDFYNVKGWLEDLHNSNPRPYEEAKPFYNMEILNNLIKDFQKQGWKIIVTSWLALNATNEFDDLVRIAKKTWLEKYEFPYDEIHLVKYGTTKADCTRKQKGFQILIDDNEKIRKGWHLGSTVDANKNIIIALQDILQKDQKIA